MKLLLYSLLSTLATAQSYYYNSNTQEVTWEDPTTTFVNEEGYVYYLDPLTGESTWKQPDNAAWRIGYDHGNMREYYYNENTGESVWDRPDELAWHKIEIEL